MQCIHSRFYFLYIFQLRNLYIEQLLHHYIVQPRISNNLLRLLVRNFLPGILCTQ